MAADAAHRQRRVIGPSVAGQDEARVISAGTPASGARRCDASCRMPPGAACRGSLTGWPRSGVAPFSVRDCAGGSGAAWLARSENRVAPRGRLPARRAPRFAAVCRPGSPGRVCRRPAGVPRPRRLHPGAPRTGAGSARYRRATASRPSPRLACTRCSLGTPVASWRQAVERQQLSAAAECSRRCSARSCRARGTRSACVPPARPIVPGAGIRPASPPRSCHRAILSPPP